MSETVRLDSIDEAIADLIAGRPVVVIDDESRENEGDLIFAAEHVTEDVMAFTIRHSSGVVCVPMPESWLDRLHLDQMTAHPTDPLRTAYTISVDARTGVSTGISAADRARTIRVLADPTAQPDDLARPGHVFPLRARAGGVLTRPGHTEAAVDLVRLAGLSPVGVIAELVNDDGTMQRGPELRQFCDRYGLRLVSIEALVHYRRRVETQVERIVTTNLPTAHGVFRLHGYRSVDDSAEHLVLTTGDLTDRTDVLVRVHSECLTGDALGSHRCDCGDQLEASLDMITRAGAGVLVYLRGHEGRGIGLLAKLQAYALQDSGRDTVDANLDLGLAADARHYAAAAQILRDLQVRSVRLVTNNPDKINNLRTYGVDVAGRVPLAVTPTTSNLSYLMTKRDRLGHLLPDLTPKTKSSVGGAR